MNTNEKRIGVLEKYPTIRSRRELESLRADAERYRKVRDHIMRTHQTMVLGRFVSKTEADFDKAVDAIPEPEAGKL